MLTVELIEQTPEEVHYQIISGGMPTNPTWDEYIIDYMEEFRPHLELIKKYIVDNGLIGTTGEQQDCWTFKFSDGTHIGFTWRAWGDFMQAVVGKREGYLSYYM